jgi:hypothetical protein
MKASGDQLSRIQQLARETKLDLRSLRGFTGCALAELDRETASNVIRVLVLVDELPHPSGPAEAASRFSSHWNGAQWAPVAGRGERSNHEQAEETWKHFIETSLVLPAPVPDLCPRCGGIGTLPTKRTKTKLLAMVYGPSSASRTVMINSFRRPTFGRLQRLASHFDGDLNAAAAFAIKLADLLEKDKP